MLLYLPHPVLVGIKAAVQVVYLVVVGITLVFLAIDGKPGAADAVGVASHRGTEEGTAGSIRVSRVLYNTKARFQPLFSRFFKKAPGPFLAGAGKTVKKFSQYFVIPS